jgi:hypothetical protein
MALRQTATVEKAPDHLEEENVKVSSSQAELLGENQPDHGTQVAPVRSSAPAKAADLSEFLSEEELAELDLGFGAFPLIVLDKGEFVCKTKDMDIEQGFDFRILGFKAKFCFKVKASDDEIKAKGIEPSLYYSYSVNAPKEEQELKDIIEYWSELGFKYETLKYFEVRAQMVAPGQDYDGEYVLLSIPPTSRGTFSGYIASVVGKFRKRYDEVITHAGTGKKIEVGRNSWKPWDFRYVRDAA